MRLVTWEQVRRGDVVGIPENTSQSRDVNGGFYVLRKRVRVPSRKLLRRAMICGARRRERKTKDTGSSSRNKVKIFHTRRLNVNTFKFDKGFVRVKLATDFMLTRFDNVKEAKRLAMLEVL